MAVVLRNVLRGSGFLLLLLLPVQARAEGPAEAKAADSASAGESVRPKRTVLHFEDDSIRGDLTRPDGELVQAPKRVAEGTLVRLRRSFTDRALSSVVRGE